jgi:hypothetical protein
MLYSFCDMSGTLYLETVLQQPKMKTKAQRKTDVSADIFMTRQSCSKSSNNRGGDKFNLMYSRFIHIDSGEEFLFFIANFSDQSDATLAEAALRIEEIARISEGFRFHRHKHCKTPKRRRFGANFSSVKSAKSASAIREESNPYCYSPLMYTNYNFCDPEEYFERTYNGTGKTGYVVVRFKKLGRCEKLKRSGNIGFRTFCIWQTPCKCCVNYKKPF